MSKKFNYITWALMTCLTVLLVSGIFNFIIDPYNIFQTFSIAGVNTSKAGAGDRVAFSKTYMSEKVNAKTIILGTSKFDIGLDPESRYIPEKNKPAFNYGVPGSDVYDQYRYLQHASSNYKPNLVIIGLDFEEFLSNVDKPDIYPPSSRNFERRLKFNYDGTWNDSRAAQILQDYSAALLSNAAIDDSVRTIADGSTVWLTKQGLSSGRLRFGSEVKNKGYFSVFRDTIRKEMTKKSFGVVSKTSFGFMALDDIIKFCARRGIDLIIVIPPYHAYQYELWKMLNLWDKFEQWKILLAEKINESKSRSEITISLWDYAFYNETTTEDVPLAPNQSSMKWYWEPIHFKRSNGDLILMEVFSQIKNGMGKKLDLDNVCEHLRDVRVLHDKYHKDKKDQIENFRKIVAEKYLPKYKRIELDKVTCRI